LTQGEKARRAAVLTELVGRRDVEVREDDACMPDGFDDPTEAQLHTATALLDEPVRTALTTWWLAVPRKATTPNWDIACRCWIGGTRGLLLIEAKAHQQELQKEEAGKALKSPVRANGRRNHVRIGACIEEASIALASETRQLWGLAREHHYQMSNRFAWAWKLAELGVPVVLVYLGFLGCEDMAEDCTLIRSDAEWQTVVRKHSATIAPPEVWDRSWQVHGQSFVPLIRVIDVPLLPAV
jgi:hypothetical protein